MSQTAKAPPTDTEVLVALLRGAAEDLRLISPSGRLLERSIALEAMAGALTLGRLVLLTDDQYCGLLEAASVGGADGDFDG